MQPHATGGDAVTLPDATPQPCSDCPWVRTAMRGWLGPFTADEWIAIAHSDEPVACHRTIKVSGRWEGASQCRGLASFREHICKSPRNPEVVVGPHDVRVFATNAEFRSHHDSPLADYLASMRGAE